MATELGIEGGLTKPKVYTSNEMDAALQISRWAHIAGFETSNDGVASNHFATWAVEFEQTVYEDENRLELIEEFAREKIIGVLRKSGGRICDEVTKSSFEYVANALIDSGKELSFLDTREPFSFDVAKVVDVSMFHVGFSLGKKGVVLALGKVDFTPEIDSVCRLDFKPGSLVKITPNEQVQDKSVER